jgi:hypothetical protein
MGSLPVMDRDEFERLLRDQDGVVSYGQLRQTARFAKHDIERLVRRRELVRVHPRVYVDHTGPLTWRQRAWAAVLYAEPAALCLDSAAHTPDDAAPIDVAIEASRRLSIQPGIRLHRMTGLRDRVLWNLSPPRTRPEETTLDRVQRARSELEVVQVLSEAIGARITTVPRVRDALGRRPHLPRHRWVVRLLDDLELGIGSVLEHGYLTRVERAHGLPAGTRQTRRTGIQGSEYRDVEYAEFGLVVELDGRFAHESWAAGGRDADRDLDDRSNGRETVRLRWRQVFGTPCRTAVGIGRILRRRGWQGEVRPCGTDCTT